MATPAVIGGLVIILFGALNCYLGYKWFRVLLGIWGFIFGGGLGMTLMAQAPPLFVLVAGMIGAAAGTFLIYFLFRMGIFLIGAVLGYMLATALFASFGTGENALLYGLVGAAIFGGLALLLKRYFVIVITAFLGASTIVTGLTLIAEGERIMQTINEEQVALRDAPTTVGAVWLLFAVSGILIQYVLYGMKNG